MKANRFKQVVKEGQIPIGHMLFEFGTRGVAQILENAGLDFVVVDMEHTGNSEADIANLMAWFHGTAVAPFVRVPQPYVHFISRTLDAGALGIMVPNVKDAAQARCILDAAKYAPLGDRGMMMGGAGTGYQQVRPREYMDFANQNTTIILQIESQQGLDNLEEIAAMRGVDVLWVGQFDMSQSLGIPAEFHHPKFLEALRKVVETARRHGLGAGIQPGNMEQTQEWIEMGFNVISFSSDLDVYSQALAQSVSGVRRLTRG